MPYWAVRPLRGAVELDAVLRIEGESFTNPWTRAMYLAEFERPEVAHIDVATPSGPPGGAHDDDAIAGFCSYWHVIDEVHVNNLAVTPSLRQQGVATSLVEHLVRRARALETRRVILEVRRSNAPARRLYERLGFTVLAERPAYYSHPVEDALVLTLDLAGAIRSLESRSGLC